MASSQCKSLCSILRIGVCSVWPFLAWEFACYIPAEWPLLHSAVVSGQSDSAIFRESGFIFLSFFNSFLFFLSYLFLPLVFLTSIFIFSFAIFLLFSTFIIFHIYDLPVSSILAKNNTNLIFYAFAFFLWFWFFFIIFHIHVHWEGQAIGSQQNSH